MFQTTKKRKPKPDRTIENTTKLFNEPLNLTSSYQSLNIPIQHKKLSQESNVIDLSVEHTAPKPQKSSLSNFQQSSSQDLTAINKKLMKMDTVMKPTFTNPIVASMQHHLFNFSTMGAELPPAFQNLHVPMFGFSVPPPIVPTSPVIVQAPMNSNTNYQIPKPQPIILNEPIEVSSDESTKGGEDMEIEPPTIQELPPKEKSPDKSSPNSPLISRQKKERP